MKRLMEKTVFLGLVIAWRRATWPTSRSPSLVNATTEGVVRPPSALGMTTGSPPSMTATTEFVVPRSIPMTFAIGCSFVFEFSSRDGVAAFREEQRTCQAFPWFFLRLRQDFRCAPPFRRNDRTAVSRRDAEEPRE